MQLSIIVSNVCDQIDDSSDSMKARVIRYINYIQQDVLSRYDFDFQLKKTYLQCSAPYDTGTVEVTNASAAVTGSDTIWTDSMEGMKIRINGGSEYYTISSVDSGTSITLDQSYLGDSDDDLTYIIYQDIYSLASDVDKITDMACPSLSQKLYHISRQEFDARESNPQSVGVPRYHIPAGIDSSGYQQIQLFPIPGDEYIIYYWYRKLLSDLAEDTDISKIPTKYHKLLYLGALAQTYEYDGNPMSNNIWTQYENMILNMIEDLSSGSEDSILVVRSTDEVTIGTPPVRLPPDHYE
jgi:hypothetical protein